MNITITLSAKEYVALETLIGRAKDDLEGLPKTTPARVRERLAHMRVLADGAGFPDRTGILLQALRDAEAELDA